MDIKNLQNIFTFHPVKGNQTEKYQEIRLSALNLSILINDMCPESAEKTTSIRKLQEAVMFANASIAIHE